MDEEQFDGEIDMHFPDEKFVKTIIKGKQCTFKAFFSLSDYEVVIKDLEVKNGKPEYRAIVAKIVLGHACADDSKRLNPSDLPDDLLMQYIDIVVNSSEGICAKYNKNADILDCYERFILSIRENLNDEIEKVKEGLKRITIPQIPQIKIPKEIFDIKPLLPDTSAVSKMLSVIAKTVIDTEAIRRSITESFQPIIEQQQVFIRQIAQQAAKILVDLPSLSLTKKEIEAIRESYRKWGEYGWTIPPHANIRDFWQEPTDIKKANSTASKYCTHNHMLAVIAEISQIKGVKKSDFAEAVDDYNDKRYKSCACILFSLIDAKLIRMQDRQTNRAVGKGAVDKAKQKIINDSEIESKVFTYLRFENVYSCLLKMFEKGNNFIQQPDVMNRNFLDHGMLTRRVIKRDCDQLFLLYYNMLMLLDNI